MINVPLNSFPVVSSYHGEAIRSLWGPVVETVETGTWACEVKMKAWCWNSSWSWVMFPSVFFLGGGGHPGVFFFERVQTGRARRLTMCWWLQLKKRLVFQTAIFSRHGIETLHLLSPEGIFCQFVKKPSLRNSENYEAKLVSEDRLEFNDGDVWLKAPKVASAPRKRKAVEDRGETDSRFV